MSSPVITQVTGELSAHIEEGKKSGLIGESLPISASTPFSIAVGVTGRKQHNPLLSKWQGIVCGSLSI